jgi:ribonuclease III
MDAAVFPSSSGHPGEASDHELERLETSLGYRFRNRGLLRTSLRHRSFVYQVRDTADNRSLEDNQRFEFLGDTVLSLSISTLLFHRFRDRKEGGLSRMRAGLVNEIQLADLARSIGLPSVLALGRGEEATGGRNKNSILADAMEALLASIYLDGGFESAFRVVKTLWGDLVDRSPKDDLLKDYKTRLQEETQRALGLTPEYHLTGGKGPDHDRTFEVTLFLGSRAVSTGQGHSKKEAEQAAARTALKIVSAQGDDST